jgi:pimeloyl-ACP methyl ester carboxylesterase
MPPTAHDDLPLEVLKRSAAAGQNTPIVCVHGAWHGAWCWEPFLDYFARHGYAGYAPSLRGHGASPNSKSLKVTRIADYVADVRRTVDQVVAETGRKPVLIGHSMGGLVVQKYLETDPEIPRAILLAPVPVHGVWQATLRVFRRLPLPFIRANLTWSLWPLVSTPGRVRNHFFSKTVPADKLARWAARVQDESYLGFLDMLLFCFAAPANVSVPVLIMGATRDMIFSPAEITKTAGAYNHKPVMFADMAHDMMLEEGWEQVAEQILSAL